MKQLLFCLTLAALFSACCRYVDCAPGGFIELQFVSAADSTDLFSTGPYNPDSLVVQVCYEKTGCVVDSNVYHTMQNNKHYFELWVLPEPKSVIFRFHENEADTLALSYYLEKTECCGKRLVISGGVFRGDTVVYDESQLKMVLKK